MAALRTEALTVSFGGLRALQQVDLTIDAGQVVGLIGANGAGKTTFIDAITGFVPSSGRVLLGGREINRLAPHVRSRAGLGRTWQAQELFDDLSVGENIQVAAERSGLRASFRDLITPRRRHGRPASGSAIFERLNIAGLADRMPPELSQAERKLVGIGRSLAGDPDVICMDEPAAGLGVAESRAFGDRIREMAADGLGVLLVDHDMGLVLGVCDYVYVIEFGKLIAQGPPAEVRLDQRVIASYLGDSAITNGAQ